MNVVFSREVGHDQTRISHGTDCLVMFYWLPLISDKVLYCSPKLVQQSVKICRTSPKKQSFSQALVISSGCNISPLYKCTSVPVHIHISLLVAQYDIVLPTLCGSLYHSFKENTSYIYSQFSLHLKHSCFPQDEM